MILPKEAKPIAPLILGTTALGQLTVCPPSPLIEAVKVVAVFKGQERFEKTFEVELILLRV